MNELIYFNLLYLIWSFWIISKAASKKGPVIFCYPLFIHYLVANARMLNMTVYNVVWIQNVTTPSVQLMDCQRFYVSLIVWTFVQMNMTDFGADPDLSL